MSNQKTPDINEVRMAGNLTRDPELAYTGGGAAYCNFCVASTKYYKKKDGTKGEKTTFLNCVAWNKSAEWIASECKKGRPVYVEGSLDSDEWEDKDTGKKRTALKLTVRRLQTLTWSDENSTQDEAPSPAQTEQSAPVDAPIPEDDIPF